MHSAANSTKIAIIAIIFVVVLSGCALQKKEKIPTEEELRRGTDALVMSFIENTPPAKIFSAEDSFPESGLFQVGIRTENKGASDIVSGILALSLETGYVNDLNYKWKSTDEAFNDRYEGNSVTFSLDGKKPENPAGGRELFSKILQAKIPGSDKESQTRKSTIIATACYDYKTRKTASVCIEPNPFAEKIGQRPCEVKDLTFDSQGAPLALTKISPRMVLKGNAATVEFLIYIKNRGNGQVIPSNKILAACEAAGGGKDFWNTINEEDFRISLSTEEGNFKCGPFPLRISGKEEDYIRCVYEGIITGTQAYATTLNLEFDYGYTQSISKDIAIERPPQITVQ